MRERVAPRARRARARAGGGPARVQELRPACPGFAGPAYGQPVPDASLHGGEVAGPRAVLPPAAAPQRVPLGVLARLAVERPRGASPARIALPDAGRARWGGPTARAPAAHQRRPDEAEDWVERAAARPEPGQRPQPRARPLPRPEPQPAARAPAPPAPGGRPEPAAAETPARRAGARAPAGRGNRSGRRPGGRRNGRTARRARPRRFGRGCRSAHPRRPMLRTRPRRSRGAGA
jgi:hypothetical protein